MAEWKSKLIMRLPAIILLVATALFWSFYDRYKPAGPILLSSPELSAASRSRGSVAEDDNRFILTVLENGELAEVRFRLPTATDYSLIRVHARIKVEGVVEGKYRWRCARLLLLQYDADNIWIPGDHGVVAERGTKDWEGHADEFEMFPGAAYAEVILQQSGTTGRAEFDRITAQPVRVRTSFIWWRLLFVGLWVAAAVYYFPRCRLHRRRLKVLIFLNAIAILAGALMPGDWISDNAERVKASWAKISKPVSGETTSPSAATPEVKQEVEQTKDTRQMDRFNEIIGDTHRTGHFVLFASLCFLVYLSAALERQHPFYFFKVALDVLLFAVVTESLQFLTLDRTAGASDLMIDFYGMAAAFVLFLIALPLIRRRCVKEGLEV